MAKEIGPANARMDRIEVNARLQTGHVTDPEDDGQFRLAIRDESFAYTRVT